MPSPRVFNLRKKILQSSIKIPNISKFSRSTQDHLLSDSETLTNIYVFKDPSKDGILVPYMDPPWLNRLPHSLREDAKQIYYNSNLFVIKDFPGHTSLRAGRMDFATGKEIKELLMNLAVVCKSGSDDECWEKSLLRDQLNCLIGEAKNLHLLVLDVTDCCVPPPQENLSKVDFNKARIQIWPEFKDLVLPLLDKLTNLQKLVIICYGNPRLIYDLNERLSNFWVYMSNYNSVDGRTWHNFTKCGKEGGEDVNVCHWDADSVYVSLAPVSSFTRSKAMDIKEDKEEEKKGEEEDEEDEEDADGLNFNIMDLNTPEGDIADDEY